MKTILLGERGDHVRDVQQRLTAFGLHVETAELEGVFGASTEAAVRAFQQRRGLLVDGKVGAETWSELVEAGYTLGDRTLYLRYPYFRGDDVRDVQRRLNALGFDAGREDGIFGERCDRAVRDFQRNVGVAPSDGIVGSDTVHAIDRVRRSDDAMLTSGALVRELETLRRADPSLRARKIAIDPGHGPDDPGAVGASGATEAELTIQLAEAIAAEVGRRGAETLLLRRPGEAPQPGERAVLANAWGADLCVSIHLNGHTDPSAEGSTCLYFGNEVTHSPAGRALADSVQEDLVNRLGLMDGRTHPMSFTMLRETRMPAVQIEPCFLTNPREERLLGEEAFRRDVALAIVQGIERYLSARGEATTSAGADVPDPVGR